MVLQSSKSNDTEQLVNRKVRNVDGKRIFVVIGLTCISLVTALLLMLYAFDRDGEQSTMQYSETIVFKQLERSKIEHNIEKLDESNQKIASVKNDRLKRIKRQLSYDLMQYAAPTPEDSGLRQKREQLQEIRAKFDQCRSVNPLSSECERFHREMVEIHQHLEHELQNSNFGRSHGDQNYAVDQIDVNNFGNFHGVPNSPGEFAMHELNREGQISQSVNEYSPFPRIHEELDDRLQNSWIVNESPQIAPELSMPLSPPSPSFPIARDNDKMNPLKVQNFDTNGQILRICDQINQQNLHLDPQTAPISNVPEPTFTGSVTNIPQPHNPNFQPSFQSVPLVQQQQQLVPQPQQQQAFPTAPVLYRSNPQPVCVYPQAQQVQLGQSLIIPQQFVAPVANTNAANRFVLVNGNAQQFGATSPSGQGFIQVLSARSEPQPSANQANLCPFAVQNQNVSLQVSARPTPIQKNSPTNDPQGLDSFYASLANRLASINVTNPFNECKTGETSCVNSVQCIPNEKWCDNIVDCRDSSDETACACTSRLDEEKLCDGYLDCPLGTDEIGCFGCAKNQYSCFSNNNEFQMSNSASGSMCYTLDQKCDGITHCLNGRDEEECSMLIKSAELHTTFMVPYTEGILYRNFRGRWYPVCENPMDWAIEACEAEMDEFSELPEIQGTFGALPGPYISKISQNTQISQQIRFSETCPMDPQSRTQIHTLVKCPELKCGTTKRLMMNAPVLRVRDENERNKRNEYLRIVGGDRSTPHSWPYIVAIYKNGHFHCGGTIYNRRWIISAAHCVTKAEKGYYEVQAGLLRRYSFAPEVQISKVTHVIVNTDYDQYEMMNDIALLRLEQPLIYNRWVRPICLPTPERVTSKFDENWMFGPPPGTVCTVIGWGDTLEGGASSDNLEEVNVPIMKSCKSISDKNGKEICAGEAAGGRDACQGDSGGPFVCRSNVDPTQSYLAGIVSHGEGCARRNEPGVYTRVALYVDWINTMTRSDLSISAKQTRLDCPGFVCSWSNRCVSFHSRCNGRIDCLGGEDELNCAYSPVGSSRKRIGRQNGQTVLPDEQSPPATLAPPVQPTLDVAQHTESTTPMQKSNSESTTTATATAPMLHSTTPESMTTPDPLDPNSDAENSGSTKKTDHRNDFTVTSSSDTDGSDVSTNPSTSSSTSTTRSPIPITSELPITTVNTTDTPITEKPTTNTEEPVITTPITPTTAPPVITTAATPLTTTSAPPPPPPTTFQCREIPQVISIALRCDGHGNDCEDGSDEKNCTCRESLHGDQEHLICDGAANCLDGEDEVGCLTCSTDQYACPRSKTCIENTSRCDKHNDCELREDEDNCFALTDGKTILIDSDLRPKLNHKGIVCENVRGNWSVKCVRRADQIGNTELASIVCFSLGFTGHTFFNISRVDEKGEIQRRDPPEHERSAHYYQAYLPNSRQASSFGRFKRNADPIVPHQHAIMVGAPSQICNAIYVECIPHSTIPVGPPPVPEPDTPKPIDGETTVSPPPKPTVHPPVDPEHEHITLEPDHLPDAENGSSTEPIVFEDNFSAPWLASIYIDGELMCLGILLDRQWILVENSCVELADLDQNMIVVVLGKAQKLVSPFEKIHRVNCQKALKRGAGTLLFLSNSIQFDRYTLPTYIPPNINDEDTDCVAVSHGKMGGFISVPVIRNDTDCPDDAKNCYQAIEPLENVICDGFDAATHGVVVCRDSKNNTYYPISLFSHENGLCSFNNLMELELLEPSYSQLQLFINWPVCANKKENVPCEGHRCPLGSCIPEDRVCDRKRDCHDGSDETDEICKSRGKCGSNEIKCASGNQCIPKVRFCDKIIDCKDLSDEPAKCTCRAYLALTDKSKICDDVPNCADKTDELNCPCKHNSYKCGSGDCIPAQFICDNQNDCPQGEDESGCVDYTQQPPQPPQSNGYQYNQRSARQWHSICQSELQKPTKTALMDACGSFGEFDADPNGILYQLIASEPNPTKNSNLAVVATNMPFTNIHMNHKFNLTVLNPRRKTSHSIDGTDCPFVLEFNCGID